MQIQRLFENFLCMVLWHKHWNKKPHVNVYVWENAGNNIASVLQRWHRRNNAKEIVNTALILRRISDFYGQHDLDSCQLISSEKKTFKTLV